MNPNSTNFEASNQVHYMPIPANQLDLLSTGTIESIKDSPLKINLLELGFLPGKKITLTHTAPGKGPLAFRLGATTLALRENEAALISVLPE